MQIVGDSLRVDTTLAQALANSIVHLVRNAADHGLETTEERLRLGKHKNGHVTITCTEDSENIRVKMIDDGRGLNLDRIKKKAAEQGLYSQDEITNMSRQRIMSFIFESGFSTAAKVTDVSGRGVGMDMVRSSIEAVGGKIDIDSEEGKGATFSLVLPIPRSVLIIDSLLVEISGHTLAIPQDSILRLLMLEKSEIAEQVSSVEGSRGPAYVLRTQEDIIPVIDLVDVLQLTTTSEAKSGLTEQLNLIIVKSGELKAALRVDQILDAEEIVVKPLHNTIEKLGVYGGATFMGVGRIGLILNVEKIISNLNASSALTEASRNLDATPLESDINLVKPASEYLIFTLDARGNYAMKLADVFRLEEIPIGNFSIVGDQETLIYRNQVIPIIDVVDKLRLERPTKVENTPEKTERCLIIVRFDEQIFGLVIESIKDVKSSNREVSTDVVCRSGIEGILILDNMTLTLISPVDVLKLAGYDVSPVNPEISQGQIQTIDANIVTAAAVAALAPAVEIAQKVPFDMSAGFGFFD
ncbi:MAG: chemotaxis protein CheW [Proteobacteria bacterium]|nr:chemotaxis protein CheW [Pseudomonadota bacterium]